ncbi:MAG TPA: class I adenylate-forming enzyme family protein [Kineosporiaceae bacterium]
MTGGDLTVPHLVRSRLPGDGDRAALVVDGSRVLTCGQWWDGARRVATGLRGRGVRPGDRIGLVFDGTRPGDWVEHAVAVVGTYLTGATVVGLPAGIGPSEVAARLRRCGATGVLHGAGVPTGGDDPGGPDWSGTPDEVSADVTGPEPDAVPVGPGDVAEIIHTSGTTGRAKPVAVPHANLTYGHATGGRLPGAGPSVLAPVELGSNAGHSAILIALVGGSTVHVLTDLSAAAVADALTGTHAGTVILPAPLATRLVAADLLTGRPLDALGAVLLGSTMVPAPVVAALGQYLPGARIVIGYGSTEAAPAGTQLVVGAGPVPAGSVGPPRPGTRIEIRDEARQPLPAGVIGQVWLRCDAPSRWYLDGDDGTFRDGWTRMGDLGLLDGDGALRLVDRAADGMVRDGRRIRGSAVEDALHAHPDVVDTAVVLVSDGPAARLVAGVETRRPVSPDELRRFVADRLPPHEVPDVVVPVDALPRGGIGKVLKHRLRSDPALARAVAADVVRRT